MERWNDGAYSPPVVHMATGFGDLIIENAKAIGLIAGSDAPAKPLFMAAVRGRSSDLPVFSMPVRQPAHSCHLIVWRRLSDGIGSSK